jgi:DNA invertase Pin-like site-specific DNA recombinase
MTKRAALYVRISTDRQTVENQIAALSKVAAARGWQIVETFSDAGIGGVKGRKDRAGLDEMLKQAQRGKFDVVMAWRLIVLAAPWSICATLSRPSRLVGSICTSINKQSTLLRQAAS